MFWRKARKDKVTVFPTDLLYAKVLEIRVCPVDNELTLIFDKKHSSGCVVLSELTIHGANFSYIQTVYPPDKENDNERKDDL